MPFFHRPEWPGENNENEGISQLVSSRIRGSSLPAHARVGTVQQASRHLEAEDQKKLNTIELQLEF